MIHPALFVLVGFLVGLLSGLVYKSAEPQKPYARLYVEILDEESSQALTNFLAEKENNNSH